MLHINRNTSSSSWHLGVPASCSLAGGTIGLHDNWSGRIYFPEKFDWQTVAGLKIVVHLMQNLMPLAVYTQHCTEQYKWRVMNNNWEWKILSSNTAVNPYSYILFNIPILSFHTLKSKYCPMTCINTLYKSNYESKVSEATPLVERSTHIQSLLASCCYKRGDK